MIDIENEIFSEVADYVDQGYPGVYLTSEYVKAPSSFPAASLVEIDNTVVASTQTSGNYENHATVLYEANVYSNKHTGKKSECKEIIALIDERMTQMGFTRVMRNVVPDLFDATIYRMVARYRAVVSRDHVVYRP